MTEKTAYFQEKTLYQHPDGPSIKPDENGLTRILKAAPLFIVESLALLLALVLTWGIA